MRNLQPVAGHPDLMRDLETDAIVNINRSKAQSYRNLREQKKREQQEINNLKTDVSEIKAMLQKLLENGSNG